MSLLEDAVVEAPVEEQETPPQEVPEDSKQSSYQPIEIADRPEFLEEQFWNSEKGEANIEVLAKSYKDLRTEFNKRNDDKVGETFEDYATEDFFATQEIAEIKDDPAMKIALEAAKESGLGVKQAHSFINKFMSEMSALKPQPVDMKEELMKLGKNGPHMVSGIKTWVDGIKNRGDINEEVHAEILKLGATAAGIKALDFLRQKSGVLNIPTGAAMTGTTHMSAQDWYSATYDTHAENGESKDAYNVRMHELGKTIFGEGVGTFNGSGLGTGRK